MCSIASAIEGYHEEREHSPYYRRDSWSQCTSLEFSHIYHLRNVFQSWFSQGGTYSFKEKKKGGGGEVKIISILSI